MTMLLNDFLLEKGGRWQVSLQDPELLNLQQLLNCYLYYPPEADRCLKRLYFIRDNWSDKKILEKRFETDYWDEEYLEETGLEYGWFSFVEYHNIQCYMHQSEQLTYIIDDCKPQNAITELSLNDLVDLVEQWKAICAIPFPKKHWWKFRK